MVDDADGQAITIAQVAATNATPAAAAASRPSPAADLGAPPIETWGPLRMNGLYLGCVENKGGRASSEIRYGWSGGGQALAVPHCSTAGERGTDGSPCLRMHRNGVHAGHP